MAVNYGDSRSDLKVLLSGKKKNHFTDPNGKMEGAHEWRGVVSLGSSNMTGQSRICVCIIRFGTCLPNYFTWV